MARSTSSNVWLQEHVNDHYVHMAKKDGYRARAAYKLLEINEKDKLIGPGTVLADLGSAPGSWSQVAARLAGSFETWRRYDEARQQLMRAELEAILALPGISPNLFEVAGKILHGFNSTEA